MMNYSKGLTAFTPDEEDIARRAGVPTVDPKQPAIGLGLLSGFYGQGTANRWASFPNFGSIEQLQLRPWKGSRCGGEKFVLLAGIVRTT